MPSDRFAQPDTFGAIDAGARALITALQGHDTTLDAEVTALQSHDATLDAQVAALQAADLLRATRIADVDATAISGASFGSIPQTYAHLLLVVAARVSDLVGSAILRAWLNSDTTAVYYNEESQAVGNATSVTTLEEVVTPATSCRLGILTGGNAPASTFGVVVVVFPHYTLGAYYKHFLSWSFAPLFTFATGGLHVRAHGGVYEGSGGLTTFTLWPSGPGTFQRIKATLYGLP